MAEKGLAPVGEAVARMRVTNTDLQRRSQRARRAQRQEAGQLTPEEAVAKYLPDGSTALPPDTVFARLPRAAQVALRTEAARRIEAQEISDPGTVWERPVECACDGGGWLMPPYAYGHPLWGKMVACACKDTPAMRRKRLADYARLPKRHGTFDNWQPMWNRGCNPAKVAVEGWVAGESNPWLLLLGNYGLGKSHLLQAAAAACVQRNIPCAYWTVANLADEARGRMFEDDTQYAVTWVEQVVAYAPRLCLDDVGREHITAFSTDLLFRVLDLRTGANLPTLISTNFGHEALLGRYEAGGALVSRVYSGDVIVMEGNDQRYER